MICKECFYFRPCWVDSRGYGGCPATCQHPDGFQPVKRQSFEGKIYTATKRIKDIIDFVDGNDNCERFVPFEIKEEKKKLWGFIPYTIKIKVPIGKKKQ